ncbi:MAG TPA: hypothetical protein DIW47_05365 [Bacteroidetes bacterium]|nr:hypothetical protein [Bacteroidota bacterium]
MSLNKHETLLLQISLLRLEKKVQEEELKDAWKSFAGSMNPVAIVKDSLHKLTQDPEIQADLGSAAMHAGASLIIGKVLGKHRSIKGYVASVIVEKLYFSFIDGPLFKAMKSMRKTETEEPNKN